MGSTQEGVDWNWRSYTPFASETTVGLHRFQGPRFQSGHTQDAASFVVHAGENGHPRDAPHVEERLFAAKFPREGAGCAVAADAPSGKAQTGDYTFEAA